MKKPKPENPAPEKKEEVKPEVKKPEVKKKPEKKPEVNYFAFLRLKIQCVQYLESLKV